MPPVQAVAELLRRARESQSLTLANAIERAGLKQTPSWLARIERAERPIDVEDARKLSAALGLDPDRVVLQLVGMADADGVRPGDFEATRRSQASRIERQAEAIAVSCIVDPDGNERIKRTFFSCGPPPNGVTASAIIVSDRSTVTPSEQPPVAVVSVPAGVEYVLEPAKIAGGWQQTLRFPDGWSRLSTAAGFTLSIEVDKAAAFEPDPEEPGTIAGHCNRLSWHVERLVLSLQFLCGWKPKLTPYAWWDAYRGPTSPNVIDRACRSHTIEVTPDGATVLTLERPLAGHAYALGWQAVRHRHLEGGACVIG